MTVKRTEDEPHDRLTRLGDAALEGMRAAPSYGDDVCAVFFISTPEGGGTAMYGYDEDREAMADVIAHIQAVFRANGMDLQIHIRGGD